MAGPRHDPATLAAFTDGERCLVWARRRSDHSLYRLPDGQAAAVRTWAKKHLECFLPDCPDRRLTTVARHPRRRDGFRHHAGAGGHSREGEAHQQAKAALVAWVHATLAGAGVRVAAEQASADRSRIADVMVTWPDGRQVAIEVQYAPLSVQRWRERHDSYQAQGITAVWLLGHTGAHLRAPRTPSVHLHSHLPSHLRNHLGDGNGAEAPLVALGDLHAAMTGAGVPLLWINPVLTDGAIATVAVPRRPHRTRSGSYGDAHGDNYARDTVFDVTPGAHDQQGVLQVDPLAACTLTPQGLTTPALQRLHANTTTLQRIDAARRRDDEERAAREAAARDRQAAARRANEERQRAEAEARARRAQRLRELHRERQQQAWDTSVLRRGLRVRYGETTPAVFTLRSGGEEGIDALPQHWRTAVYRHLIWQKVGTSFTLTDALRAVKKEGIDLPRERSLQHADALTRWLSDLQRLRYVLARSTTSGRLRVVDVLADLDHPPPATPLAVHAGAPADVTGEQFAGARLEPVVPARSAPARLTCQRCGKRLDPLLAEHGRHVLC